MWRNSLPKGEGIYDIATTTESGLMSASDKIKLDNLSNTYSEATTTHSGLMSNTDKAKLDAIPNFTSQVTLAGGFTAKSVSGDFSNSTITASNSSIKANGASINSGNTSIKASGASISGNIVFTGKLSLTGGLNNISDIQFADGKLQIKSGISTYTFSPDN